MSKTNTVLPLSKEAQRIKKVLDEVEEKHKKDVYQRRIEICIKRAKEINEIIKRGACNDE